MQPNPDYDRRFYIAVLVIVPVVFFIVCIGLIWWGVSL
jgi:hypothetical protein